MAVSNIPYGNTIFERQAIGSLDDGPENRASNAYSNQPLQQPAKLSIQQQLYQTLEAQLPLYMVPEDIVALEKLPIKANGEVDHQALARRA